MAKFEHGTAIEVYGGIKPGTSYTGDTYYEVKVFQSQAEYTVFGDDKPVIRPKLRSLKVGDVVDIKWIRKLGTRYRLVKDIVKHLTPGDVATDIMEL